jgi:hypothetical protein
MKKYYSQSAEFDFMGKKIFREKRTEFSLKEIYCIAFNRDIAQTPDYLMREQIESAFDKLGFVRQGYRKSQGAFGQQFVYKRQDTVNIVEEEIDDDDLPF